MFFLLIQAEVEAITSQLEDMDNKASQALKSVSSLESQLAESQVIILFLCISLYKIKVVKSNYEEDNLFY